MNILFDCFGRTHTDTKPRSAASPLTKLHQEIDLLLCGTKTTKSVVFQDVAITSIEQIDSISGLESLIDALPCSNVEDVLISLDLTLPLHYSPHELKNIFKALTVDVAGETEEHVQDCWLKRMKNRRGIRRLPHGFDARNYGIMAPFYLLPEEGSAFYTRTAKWDIASSLLILVLELKKLSQDIRLFMCLQQVLEKIRSMISMNSFYRRAFGFCVNGDETSLFVDVHRTLIPLGDYQVPTDAPFFKDVIRIRRIYTKDVSVIWQSIHARAHNDPFYAFHEDTPLIARAMKDIFGYDALGYTKVSLIARSNSRIYGVYANGCDPQKPFHVNKDALKYTIKVNSQQDLSVTEVNALKVLLDHFNHINDTNLKQFLLSSFYVNKAILYHTNDKGREVVEFSEMVDDDFVDRNLAVGFMQTLKQALNVKHIHGTFIPVSKSWWKRYGTVPIPTDSSVIIMKIGKSIMEFDNLQYSAIQLSLNEWLHTINQRVFHTDLRLPNIMLFPRYFTSDEVKNFNKEYDFITQLEAINVNVNMGATSSRDMFRQYREEEEYKQEIKEHGLERHNQGIEDEDDVNEGTEEEDGGEDDAGEKKDEEDADDRIDGATAESLDASIKTNERVAATLTKIHHTEQKETWWTIQPIDFDHAIVRNQPNTECEEISVNGVINNRLTLMLVTAGNRLNNSAGNYKFEWSHGKEMAMFAVSYFK